MSPRSPRTPYWASPETGRSIAARWTRTWCVRPVSSLTSRSACAAERLPHLEVRDGLAGLVGVERAPRRIAPVAADRCVDPPARRAGMALDEREIAPFDLAAADRFLERRIRLLRTSDGEQPRGVAIEPVHDPGPLGVSAGRPEREQLPRERSRPRPRSRMHDEAGRLVDDEQVLVLVRQRDGDGLRREHRGRARELDLDHRSCLQAVALRARRAVDQHRSVAQQALRERARPDLRTRGERTVEPRARVGLSDAEAKRRHRARGRASGPTGRRARACRRGRRRRRR